MTVHSMKGWRKSIPGETPIKLKFRLPDPSDVLFVKVATIKEAAAHLCNNYHGSKYLLGNYGPELDTNELETSREMSACSLDYIRIL